MTKNELTKLDYSVGGGFIEWKGYTPPKKNPPKYPFATMKELRAHADTNKTTIARIMLANEMSIAGRTEAEVWSFIDKIINAMVATVKSGLSMPEDDGSHPDIALISTRRFKRWPKPQRTLNSQYKETSEAGLALSVVLC